MSTPQVSRLSTFVTKESSDALKIRCDFDKVSPGWTKFTVTDWVVNKVAYFVTATLLLAVLCFHSL